MYSRGRWLHLLNQPGAATTQWTDVMGGGSLMETTSLFAPESIWEERCVGLEAMAMEVENNLHDSRHSIQPLLWDPGCY